MAKPRVLVVDSDEWVARLLAAGLRDHGFDVSTSMSGSAGLQAARAVEPDCIISELVLNDMDGPAMVRAVRAEQGPVATTPVLFLTNAEDIGSRVAAFNAGGDVYLTKPFRIEEIAMQTQALISMTGRIAGRRQSQPPEAMVIDRPVESGAPGVHAIEGNLGDMSIATVLTMLEMEHRTGVLAVSSKGNRCTLEMAGGCACGGTIGGSRVAPLAVLRHVLCWKDGRFRFHPGTETNLPANRRSIGALLIEAVRLDDESMIGRKYGDDDEAPTARRHVAGQSAPPSSRRSVPAVAGAKRLSRPPPTASAVRPQSPTKRLSRPPPPGSPERRPSRPAPRPVASPPIPQKKN